MVTKLTLPKRDSWFLAQLRPNSAHIAERNLKWQGFQTFLPRHEETRRIRDKFVTAVRPLFPGYIFVAFDAEGGLWRTVNSTVGVTRLVSFSLYPTSVPTDIVTLLLDRCDATGTLQPPRQLQPGDKVHLMTGPFANFAAEIEKTAADQRVWVLMDIMGGRTRVLVEPEQLQLD